MISRPTFLDDRASIITHGYDVTGTLGSPERLGPVEWRNLMSGQPAPGAWNSLVEQSIDHPLNDGASSSSSDTKISHLPTSLVDRASTITNTYDVTGALGSPERLGPMDLQNLMSGQPDTRTWNSLDKQSIDHPPNDGASSSSSATTIHLPTSLVDRASTITHTFDVTGAPGSPERLGPMDWQNLMSAQPATGTRNSPNEKSSSLSKTGGRHIERSRSGPSGVKSFMTWQWSMENSPERQINPEGVTSERYHVLSIEDREPPRRNSFDSSMRIAAGGYEFADRQHFRVRLNQQNLHDRSNPLNTGNLQNLVGVDMEHVRDEPLPIISWVEEFGMIVVGVYLFCSTALFSTAYALNEGGWIALSIYLVFLFAALFTADIIPLCFEDVSATRTYLDLGSLAFGAPGRAIVLAFLCVFSYATCIDCVMINREHFMVLWPEANTLLTIVSIVIPAIFVCFCSLNEYRPLWNGIGVFLSVIVVIILVFLGALDVGFQVKETSLFHSSTSHLSIGFFSFCLCGHSFLPSVYSRVRNRRKYRRILIIIFAISTTLYVGTGCFGYAMFGKETKSLFTLNLPRHLLVSQLAMGITVINHMFRYILNITPLAQNLEGLLPENYRNFSCRMLIRSLLAATTSLAFLSTGYYGPVVSLMGSIVGVAIGCKQKFEVNFDPFEVNSVKLIHSTPKIREYISSHEASVLLNASPALNMRLYWN
ncbi:vacuolar amino acid transporter 1 [Artemisia annua]|uniref:Vacuolar amino acid transporter 1 n=1 Tax=Artemisia annua TaxID=35608 RepID=A0A2U1PPV4_ARTAN|nr:vacuolar amino acid transporter 1 [Artemisia annua]